jgi:hypothetical protein
MTPADLYRTCRVSACRLEAQQSYARRGGDERQQAFDAGEPLPPPRQAKLDDLRLISELGQAGRKVGRVHIVPAAVALRPVRAGCVRGERRGR